ncbi:18S rRNA biogenesis protein [Aspergillus sclerotiicarbonarius CBS 121057]|uniref:18S rRNA biogenesis protein n=1 Tax=Aspergillus sclerotiicarbonarius (strain CBS 121057 / IBT 28362) TaxID=1448318 RepID=A0A319EEC2_ASPSB|nr:18S rRNA biogenesis protein [Aspergillus sclerotiicarbonarius CBS 121057]
MAPLDDVQVGDLVNVPGGMYGTVKYLGVVAGKPGKFAGIELASEHARRGKNNGDVEGRKYFATSVPGSGIFVPMNNSKYVTKRSSGPTSTGNGGPPTPSRPINFSKSVGPGPAMRPPRVRRPSLPRPESPRGPPPSKMTLTGLRTPSAAASRAPPSSSYPRSPVKAPSRASDRPPSRVSRVSTEDEMPSTRTSEVRRSSMETEVQDLKDHIKSLENQLLERDKQLDEQATTLSDFQRTLEELEGSDSLSIRAQLRERNERIAQLTAEFDLHRADFRSTLDTLEVAASETERVYEQRLDELMQQNKELQDRGEDVEAVARQLKQLEELVSELEEGLEDARRGEAEARAEVEFLRGEVERTKLELQKERDSKDIHGTGDGSYHSKELEQKDDEIRGLKAIIHSLSRGDPDLQALQQNGFGTNASDHDPEHVAHLEQRVEEYERITERKTYRIEELERELQQFQLNGDAHAHASRVTPSPNSHKAPSSNGKLANGGTIGHAHRLSDRTVVPSDWQDSPPHDGQYQAYSTRHRGISDASHHRLETMHESDTLPESDGRSDGGSLWCEICETGGHDILTCTNMFGADGKMKAPEDIEPSPDDSSFDEKSTPEASTADPSTSSHLDENMPPQKTGRDVVLEALKGPMMPSSMDSVAGKESGVAHHSGTLGGCTNSPSAYLVCATVPHALHVRFSSSAPNSSTTAFTCVPRSVHTNRFSHTISPQLLQYHRIASTASWGRGCSITTPTVSLNRTGQCGISQIRPSSPTNPGLAPHEISFLRLLESITNGSQMEISYTGTILVYKPGLVTGSSAGTAASSGGVVRHELPAGCNRGVSYYLLPLCLLAPFSKAPIKVLFTGPGVITSSTPTGDMSVDSVRTAILPLYNQFGIFNNIELRILRRSNPGPNGRGGGGEVQLVFGHQLRLPKTLHLMNAGRIKKVRGVAYSVGVSASNNARMIETTRGILNPLVPDTYVFSDVSSAPLVPAPEKSNPSGKKKIGLGFGLSLVAESSTGCLFSADVACPPGGGEAPEDIGKQCAYQLLEAVSKGGCVAPAAVPTMLGLMTMGSEDVGRIQVGRDVIADESTIQLARDLTKFGAPGWGLRDASGENENGDVIISVVGRGIGNVGRKVA